MSELLGQDSVRLLSKAQGTSAFITYRKELRGFEVLPSVNAREALKHFFESKIVIDTIVEAIGNLEHIRFEPAYNRVFTEFMRYTQVKQVVPDFTQQDQFFDRLSEFWFCNNHILFKLQWSMAMRDHGQWPRAWQYLEEAYGQAKNRENFDTSHLDDQKAGLLLDSISSSATSADYLRALQQTCDLLGKAMKKGPVTSHNYKTVTSLEAFFDKASGRLQEGHKIVMLQSLAMLTKNIDARLKNQQGGFIRDAMQRAIASVELVSNSIKV